MKVLKDTASSNSFLPKYDTGLMTDIVYSVKGGMEGLWSWMGKWSKQLNKICY